MILDIISACITVCFVVAFLAVLIYDANKTHPDTTDFVEGAMVYIVAFIVTLTIVFSIVFIPKYIEGSREYEQMHKTQR